MRRKSPPVDVRSDVIVALASSLLSISLVVRLVYGGACQGAPQLGVFDAKVSVRAQREIGSSEISIVFARTPAGPAEAQKMARGG